MIYEQNYIKIQKLLPTVYIWLKQHKKRNNNKTKKTLIQYVYVPNMGVLIS